MGVKEKVHEGKGRLRNNGRHSPPPLSIQGSPLPGRRPPLPMGISNQVIQGGDVGVGRLQVT